MPNQERLDEIVIHDEFSLAGAISSMKFYWELARQHGETLTYELWAKKGAVVPSREITLTMEGKLTGD
mgnify:CR=1 FL=1